MTVKIQFEFATAQEAADFLAKHAPTTEAPGKPDTSKPAGTSAKSTPTASAGSSSAGASASAGAASPKETEKPKSDPKPEVPSYEKSGIPEKIKAAVDKDKPGVIKLLGEFGVKKGGELKPEQFADFTVKIDALLAGGSEDLS